MKHFLFAITLLLVSAWTTKAQHISGFVLQSNGSPQEFATVTLNKAGDSTLVMGAVTGADGGYDFKQPKNGSYFIQVSMIGMEKVSGPVFVFSGTSLKMENMTLKETAAQLSQVTITAKRPVLEVKADKTIMNVEGTINSTGLNALELLRKAPGVTIDNEDNISIKGKNGVKFLIDNREVPLDSKSLAQQLKGMQASEINNIEIITNPSARYDASGNAGIINIKLKKNKALGTNGNAGFEYIQGITPKIGFNGRINHRQEKYNAFASYNNHYGIWHNEQNYDRLQNGVSFVQQANTEYYSKWNSARAGADWFINPKNTFGILVDGSTNPFEFTSDSYTYIGVPSDNNRVDSILKAGNLITNDRYNMSVNLNYMYSDTNGRILSFDLTRGHYNLKGTSNQPNNYYTPAFVLLNQFIYHTYTPTRIDITTAKGDYEQKFWKGTLSGGFKVSIVGTDNTYDFYNVIGGNEIKDNDISNRFKYTEQTNALYVNFVRDFGKLNVQAGLRLENTDYTGELITSTQQNGMKIDDNYTKLFPSAALTYMFTQKWGVNLTYSRRIDRPSYQDLNPFEFRLDELTYEKGNPDLKPQFTHSIELSPLIMGQPLIKFGYSRTSDLFTRIVDTTNTNATFITNDNVAEQDNYSVSINLPTPIRKWWDGMISFTAYRSDYKATIREGFQFEKSIEAINIYAEQNFRLPKGFSIQLSGWYNSKGMMGTIAFEPQGTMDAGIKKKFMNDRAEIGLRAGDILNTAGWKGENLFTPGLVMLAHGSWEARMVVLNFSMRFGSQDVKNARQRRSGFEEESRRIKAAGS